MSFTKGQRVHVEFDGTIRATSSEDDENEYVPAGQGFSDHIGGWGFVEVEDGRHIAHTIWVDDDTSGPHVIETVGPEEWPPVPGDIWQAGDKEYFVTSIDEYEQVYFVHNIRTDDGTTYGNSNLSLRLFAAIEPELVRRVES